MGIDTIFNCLVGILVGFVGWIVKDLKAKATQKELDEVKAELKELRTKVYETLKDLATKDDINRLYSKIDRWAEKEYEKVFRNKNQ